MMLYYTVLIRWERMAAEGRDGCGGWGGWGGKDGEGGGEKEG